MTSLKAFWRNEQGATSIEYAIIGSLLSILIVGGVTAIGTKLQAKIQPISANLG